MIENPFIKVALQEAKKALAKNEVPVGAVITKNNKIIARAHNLNKSQSDPLAHAEILAIKKACKKLDSHKLNNCNIYITLEPCLMCTSVIYLTNIANVYYCASDKKFGALESNPTNLQQSSYHQPNIYSNIGAAESKKLLQDFFQNKR